MTKNEFITITKLITSYWNETFDSFKIDTWYDVFENFKFNGLRMSIQELAKESKFAPKINDIILKYEELKNRQTMQQKLANQKEIERLTAGQEQCILCDNTGFVLVTVNGYDYATRCICPHGRDLNKFSAPQMDKSIPYKNSSGIEERIYIPTIQEFLKEDDYAIFVARKKLKHQNAKKQFESQFNGKYQKDDINTI